MKIFRINRYAQAKTIGNYRTDDLIIGLSGAEPGLGTGDLSSLKITINIPYEYDSISKSIDIIQEGIAVLKIPDDSNQGGQNGLAFELTEHIAPYILNNLPTKNLKIICENMNSGGNEYMDIDEIGIGVEWSIDVTYRDGKMTVEYETYDLDEIDEEIDDQFEELISVDRIKLIDGKKFFWFVAKSNNLVEYDNMLTADAIMHIKDQILEEVVG